MIKKILLLILLLVIATSLNAIQTKSAKAWTNDLPSCSDFSQLPTGWIDSIRTINPGFNPWHDPTVIHDCGTGTANGGYKYFLVAYSHNKIDFYKRSDGQNSIALFPQAYLYHCSATLSGEFKSCYQQMNISEDYLTGPTYTTPQQYLDYPGMTNIYSVSNVTYSPNYTGSQYSGYNTGDLSDPPPELGCSPTDLVCHVTNITTTVSRLFIPDSNAISTQFEYLKLGFEDQFGFLFFPFEFFLTIFDNFANAASWYNNDPLCNNIGSTLCDPRCERSFQGNFFGQNDVTLDFCALQKTFPSIWDVAVNFIRVATVLSLMYALYFRIMTILSASSGTGGRP